MSQEQQPKDSTSKPKKVSKVTALSTVKSNGLKVDSSKDLKEAFVVVVGIGSNTTQYTYHRPIGFTPLSDRDWICTPTDQVRYLLENRDHPFRTRTLMLRQEAILVAHEAMGHLKLQDDKYLYVHEPGGNLGRERKLALRDARNAYDVNKKALRLQATQTVKENEQPDHKPENCPSTQERKRLNNLRERKINAIIANEDSKKVIDYLNPEEQKTEALILANAKEPGLRSLLAELYPLPAYETCGGPAGDQKQMAIGWLHGADQSLAEGLVRKRIVSCGGTPETVIPPIPAQPKGQAGTSVDSKVETALRAFVTKNNGTQTASAGGANVTPP